MGSAEGGLVGPSYPRRVVFYSHDTVGLGHIRRNIALAGALVHRAPDTDVLLLTGNPEAAALPRPTRCDVVTLPTVGKDESGDYRSRALHAPLEDVLAIRAALIQAAVTSFAPDLLVVDKVPLGVGQELAPALRSLRAGSSSTAVVLGLREILDDPVSAVRDWTRSHSTQAIEAFYDAIWVYGDQAVYDPVAEYGLPPEVSSKVRYTGYLAEDRELGLRPAAGAAALAEAVPPAQPYVLCLVGGGQDGFDLAHTFARAHLPDGHLGVVICGPFMPAHERRLVHAAAASHPGMVVHDFVPEMEPFLTGAAAVVAMAGYNTVCEVVASGRRTLLVPRTRPRVEQRIRAERLADLGVVDMLSSDDLDDPRLAGWLREAVRGAGPPPHRANIDTHGLQRVPDLAAELIARRTSERVIDAA
jgi:predicted glycosyltransferase